MFSVRVLDSCGYMRIGRSIGRLRGQSVGSVSREGYSQRWVENGEGPGGDISQSLRRQSFGGGSNHVRASDPGTSIFDTLSRQ